MCDNKLLIMDKIYKMILIQCWFSSSSRSNLPDLITNDLLHSLQKNRLVPAFLQTAVIDKPVPALFENAGIGNPITATQNRRFTKRCNRRPIVAFFKNVGIGSPKALG